MRSIHIKASREYDVLVERACESLGFVVNKNVF